MPATPATAVLPSWLRGVLIAIVTLLLCSCRAPIAAPTSLDQGGLEQGAPGGGAPVFRGQSPEGDAVHAAACRSCGPVCGERGWTAPNCRACVVPGGEPLGPLDEYLCDGGDCGLKAGVRADGAVIGLELEDTVAHYDSPGGGVCITPSNRVCIYAPRFAAVRRVLNPSESYQRDLVNLLEEDASLHAAEAPLPPVAAIAEQPPVLRVGDNPPSLLRNRQQAGELEERVVVRELRNLIKPYANLSIVKLGVAENSEKPWLAKAVVSALTWTGDQVAQVVIEEQAASVLYSIDAPGVVYASPEGKPCLRLVKLASAADARPGEEVAFTLRVDNVGSAPVRNVTVVDNLTTRLQYVPESAEATCEAAFKTSRNAGGSLVLRWEIAEPIEPGEGCVMTFRVKVL